MGTCFKKAKNQLTNPIMFNSQCVGRVVYRQFWYDDNNSKNKLTMCDLPLYIVDIFIYILVAGQLCFDLISCGNRGLYAIYNMIICLTRYIFSVKRLNIYHHFLCPKIYIITFKRGFKTLIKFGIRLSQCNISIKVQGETRV